MRPVGITVGRLKCIWFSAAALLVTHTALGADAPAHQIAWNSDVARAWQRTQDTGRPLLVFVTAKQCGYCVKMKQTTFAHPKIAAAVNGSFVPLVLEAGGNSPLLKDLDVKAFPATFVISPDAVILDRLDGYVAPEALIKRLATMQSTATVEWHAAGSSKY